MQLGPQLRPQLRNALLQLRVEPREVDLEQLSELRSVGYIHFVEPVHESVDDPVAELGVELF
jgi:hypothetical protein